MHKRRWSWILMAALIILVVGIIGLSAGAQKPVPVQLLTHFPLATLAEEAYTMNECLECHEPSQFHTCTTCHDDHGAIEMENVPFYAGITFGGDVPHPGYVLIDDILPYRDQPHTHLPLLDFLAQQGVADFESVTLTSNDGGFVTITRENLTASALLMPYEDGIRFADENLHISSWIKGIQRIIVVEKETPLVIDGQSTSIGRLLIGPTQLVTVEQTDVMFKSEEDGAVRKASSGSRVEGVPIVGIVANPAFTQLVVRDASGAESTLSADEARGALLVQLRGQVTLVLPKRGRSQWITDVVELRSE
ncbi:MAG TPA: hypothetical protein PLH19_14425 [Anaerolineae bacterium]|nr:hypothetical protein [Anaerolineae bacterium]HQH39713.1 hypothetical protein [Anaerolineae bacterium]